MNGGMVSGLWYGSTHTLQETGIMIILCSIVLVSIYLYGKFKK